MYPSDTLPIQTKSCLECGSERSSNWYKHKQQAGSKVCHKCYKYYREHKVYRPAATEPARPLVPHPTPGGSCCECHAKQSTSWKQHKLRVGAMVCESCNQRWYKYRSYEPRVRQPSTPSKTQRQARKCSQCGCSSSYGGKWYKDEVSVGGRKRTSFRCKRCYNHCARVRKRARVEAGSGPGQDGQPGGSGEGGQPEAGRAASGEEEGEEEQVGVKEGEKEQGREGHTEEEQGKGEQQPLLVVQVPEEESDMEEPGQGQQQGAGPEGQETAAAQQGAGMAERGVRHAAAEEGEAAEEHEQLVLLMEVEVDGGVEEQAVKEEPQEAQAEGRQQQQQQQQQCHAHGHGHAHWHVPGRQQPVGLGAGGQPVQHAAGGPAGVAASPRSSPSVSAWVAGVAEVTGGTGAAAGAPSSLGTVQQPGLSLGAAGVGLRGEQDSGVSSVLGQEEEGKAADVGHISEGQSPDASEGGRGSGRKEGQSPLPSRHCTPVRRWVAPEGMFGGAGAEGQELGVGGAEPAGVRQGPEAAGGDLVPPGGGCEDG